MHPLVVACLLLVELVDRMVGTWAEAVVRLLLEGTLVVYLQVETSAVEAVELAGILAALALVETSVVADLGTLLGALVGLLAPPLASRQDVEHRLRREQVGRPFLPEREHRKRPCWSPTV